MDKRYPYIFKPQRDLTLEEMNNLIRHVFKVKVFPQEFYDSLPDDLKEHFVEREKEDKNNG